MSKLILGTSTMHRIDWKLLRIRPSAENLWNSYAFNDKTGRVKYSTGRSVLRTASKTHEKWPSWALTREVVLEAGESYNHPLSSGLTEYDHGASGGEPQGSQPIPQASDFLIHFFIR